MGQKVRFANHFRIAVSTQHFFPAGRAQMSNHLPRPLQSGWPW